MAHPYRSAGRAGAKLKFRNMLGTEKGAKHVNDDSVASPRAKVTNGVDDVKIMGKAPPKRLDRARGGKVGKTTVNVIVPPQPGGPPMPPPSLPMPPPVPPMAGPPGMPPGMPPKGPTLPQPGAGFPLPKARGGSVSKRADGGLVQEVAYRGRPMDKVIGTEGARGTVGGGRTTVTPLSGGQKGAMQRRINKLDPLHGIMPRKGIGKEWVPGIPPGFDLSKQPVERARGGYISGNSLKQWATYARKNSYHKKTGGGITKAELTGGADSGVGRLEHSKAQRKHMKDK